MFSPTFGIIEPAKWDAYETLIFSETNRWQSVRVQLEDPFVEIPDASNKVIEWRLLFPLVAYTLGIGPMVYVWFPALGAFLCLSWLAWVLLRETKDPWLAFLGTALLATGSWYFVTLGWLGYFDSWIILALLLVLFTQRRLVLLLTALLTPWVDERFILAVPIVLALRFIAQEAWMKERRRAFLLETACVLVPVAVYALMRVIVMRLGSDQHSSFMLEGMVKVITGDDWPFVLFGLWEGLRAGCVLVGAFLLLSYRQLPRWVFFVFLAVTFGCAFVFMTIAGDTARSASLLWPVAIAGLLLLARDNRRLALILAGGALVANLLLPAHHVTLVSQRRIRSLVEELDARNEFTVAKHPVIAYRMAMYALSQNEARNYDESLRIYDSLVYNKALDQSLPYLLIKRGEAHLARGDAEAARSDFIAAWAVAPPGSPDRAWLAEHYGALLEASGDE